MSKWRKYESLLQVLGNKVNWASIARIGMEIQQSTASCRVNFNARGSHAERSVDSEKKGEAHSETRTFRYMPYL